MSEVKWIKVFTNIFDNRKIRQIEVMPEGDSIIVIWFKILCLAGMVNDEGKIYITSEIPYTDQMLSAQFSRPIATVQLALRVLSSFGMIEVIDDIMKVSNWEKYQNIEGMEKIREQTRKRVANFRQRQLEKKEVTQCNATVTEQKEERRKKKEDKKFPYGNYMNVKLTPEELGKLTDKFGEEDAWRLINYLDEAIEEKGYKYKSHYLTIAKEGSWVQERVLGAKTEKSKAEKAKEADEAKMAAWMERMEKGESVWT